MESAHTREPGRREKNRQRTHRALVEAAARLFQEQDFESVTVRDIADAAGVGERTFFRYFPSKESLVLQQVRDLIPMLAEAIRARPTAEAPLTALRNAVLGLARREDASPTILLVGPQPLQRDSTRRGDRFLLFDMEEAVASAFVVRLLPAGADPDAADPDTVLRAAVLSRAGVAVLRAVRLTYLYRPERERSEADLTGLVHAAFDALESGGRTAGQ
ncbi:TetR family transcriptional regulator [Streptacidiphilus sp. 4-A2]|nr:TetR family transcriptional regulator [Streptacidiphilus sp. 4-A2]